MKSNLASAASRNLPFVTLRGALNFHIYGFLHFLKAEISKTQSPKRAKTAGLELQNSSNLISRKIYVTVKI